MRNLKRALSLGLTAAMISGLMVMGSSAASYADVADTDNVEAIEVLEAVGIMIGDENGDFNPDQNVTRNEMAVVMSNLMEYNVASYANTSPFTDVPSWAEPYVAACWTNGITAGTSATTYGGSDNVITSQAALMLMKALGYFQYSSDFGGDWQLATTRQGNAIDLFVGVDSGVEQAMTRNDVAQLVLNTLKSGTVEASTDGSWTIGDVTINNNVKYNYITSNADYAQSINTVTSTDANTDAGQSIIELGEQLYMGDLELKNNDTDVFGRPARTWEYDSQKIGTYAKTELLKQSYTTEVTGREMFDLLGSNVIDHYTFNISVDGETTRSILGADGVDAYFTENNFVRSNKDGVGQTGNGVLTQVYVDNINKQVYVAVINTYLAQAAEDYDEKNDELDLTVYMIDNLGSTQAPVYAKRVSNNGVLDPKDYDEIITVEGKDFAIEDVVEDDLFLVTVADGEIQTMVDPEVLEGTTISKFKKTSYVVADGTQYDYADTARYNVEDLDQYDDNNLKDVTYNVILDQYGYLIGIELVEEPDKYVFLTGVDTGSSNLSAANADANVIFTDGTMDTVTVNMRKSELVNGDRLPGGSQVNTWCTYTVSSDGVYTLKQVDTTSGHKVMQSAENVVTPNKVEIDNKHVSMTGIGGSRVYGNDDTVYLNVELKGIADARDNGGMSWIIDDVESVTVGSKNVALTVWDACDLFKDANGDGKVDAIDNKYIYPSAEIYPLFDDDNYVIAVVTIAENEGSTTNYAYITGDVNSEAYANDEYTWTLPAIVNGKKVELTEIGDTLDVLDELDKGNWYKIKYDADGYVRGYEAIENQITDGDYDSSDCYINDVAQLEKALEVNDTVLLDQYFANGVLTFENGTLYTDTAKTEGININPDVKVVLALADKNKKPFDDVDDSYTGYSGLEKALRNLDSIEKDLNNDGIADYAFIGNLAAIVEGGDGATTIILDDRSGKADPDYNPLKDMKVTINLIDRTYFYPQVLSTVTDTLDQDDFKKAGGTITYTAAQFEGNLAGLDNYKAFPDKQSYPITRFEEGKEVSIDFYYRVEEEAVTQNTIKFNTDGNAWVTYNGTDYDSGSVKTDAVAGQYVSFSVTVDTTKVTDPDTPTVLFNGVPASQTGNTGNTYSYRAPVKDGENELVVTVAPKTYNVTSKVTHNDNGGSDNGDWSITSDFEPSYKKGENVTIEMTFNTETTTTKIKTATVKYNNGAKTVGPVAVTFVDGETPVSATYDSGKAYSDATTVQGLIAAGNFFKDKAGTPATLEDWMANTKAKFFTITNLSSVTEGSKATITFSFEMPTEDVEISNIILGTT